jgi:hypothetical protein
MNKFLEKLSISIPVPGLCDKPKNIIKIAIIRNK